MRRAAADSVLATLTSTSSPSSASASISKPRSRTWARWLWLVAEAAAWVCAGAFVAYHTSLWTVVTNPSYYSLNTPLLLLAAASGAITTAIFAYFQFYVTPILKRGDEDFLQTFPRQIQTATANGVICFFSFIVAVWPVWGMLSPLITGLLCISLFFLTSLISLLTPSICR